ncbi:hypothetical protein DIU31_022680 [Mucilaginibacter rubeus]|uniref:3-isopropylmalate dehydratase n=2 Tax=Mucilaginibacter rubeus TaxID=2027860 RepID=A0A364WQC7_9SPHI|nr:MULTISPECIES: hypothetical protein [Mucilaginibacter]QEM06184.1 hypothetical protein DIU31_022680 [Mucilaginibacter rubeus]QEM13701.1 hypothetical protein DEO27_028035 [Mucilaginibacter rubeus]QEM18766.1 hypothetical protein DIU38_022915 [Mucilaginibacter gossypii]QTE36239.1 hypothetical protein J3L18_24380 [Mucilaginibacter gossypii]QTE44692.1 hypothetical protein J3L19_04805 [Mucilaginibacter rubeus]
MKIVDINGKIITVENLDLAILQADDYRHYRHANPSFKSLDEGLQAYWEDVYQKLLRLRNE